MTSQNSDKKYIVQLRGGNACGKSTAMRQYCAAHGMKPGEIDTPFGSVKVMHSPGRSVIGWYKPFSNAEGCDASVNSKEHLLSTIERLCEGGDALICFEGFIYGKTYTLPNRINALAKRMGYTFVAVLFSVPYSTELERLMNRNGGKMVNLNVFDASYFGARKAFGKLRQTSIPCFDIDTSGIPLTEMGGIIDDIIYRLNTGGTGGA